MDVSSNDFDAYRAAERLAERFAAAGAMSRVSPEEAQKHAAVYCCLRLICGALSQVHWRVRSEAPDDETRRVDALLNGAVHPRWTAVAFREWIGHCILLRGNAYAVVRRDAHNRLVSLDPVAWDRVEPVLPKHEGALRYVVDRSTALPAEDVLDFPGFGWDGLRSPSVLASGAFGALSISRDLERYTATFFRRGSLHRFIVQMTRRQSVRQWKLFKKRWVRGSRGLDGAHEPLFVPEGMAVTPLNLTNTDAELLSNRDWQVADVLRAFGVPSMLANQESKNTSFGSGLSSLLHGFARYTLSPHLRRIEAEANAKLAPTDGSWRIELDMSDLLRATLREQLDAMRVALGGSAGSGILTPNETRRFLGYPPLDDPAADEISLFRTRASAPKDSA